ncbi:hypothetical protein ASU80_17330 [Enterobacter hormaechei subsp. xiangfangensis]|uniref:hypothetical protein n=1 Tax=Enterobacter hormaechei TaxID=158836 RepID=UPI0007354D9E|nr:hypothetical protein [Enterobacter hormaechei]KTI01763.1 hypothetical protein ASV11_14385 [Enterobacter hormaechei subsp. xiangfangensis]KTJ64525.1 hypothetical protein ASU80_17330 [Enterobacter hormaechei subsp. xiangfangensis]
MTLTKEWLLRTIAELEEERDSMPGVVNEDAAMALAAMKLALASLEAEAVAWTWEIYGGGNMYAKIKPESLDARPLYTAPPSPVSVPDDEQGKPHPVMAVKGELGFLDHFDRIISERDEDIDIGQLGSSNYEALMLAALDAFRAAMLQGAENAESTTTMQTAPELDYSPKNAESPTGINQGKSEPVTTAYKFPFEQWLSQQTGTIDVECGCVMTEVFFHWLRVAYEAGNSPVVLDGACPCCGRKQLKNRTCSVSGCDGKHVAHGFCKKHYDIERKKDPSRRESIRAADKRYRARKAAAPQQEVK